MGARYGMFWLLKSEGGGDVGLFLRAVFEPVLWCRMGPCVAGSTLDGVGKDGVLIKDVGGIGGRGSCGTGC